ncbi:MAG: sulfurtransferase TusA family protein [Candidatus Omnitrophica bacterium]|nr:sulfurtransferase TusA family protein [Candidatus Omnitrophota bacterium]
MFKLPQKVLNDIEKYQEYLKKFLNGEIKDSFFRGVRVPWGFYSQRGGKILMSRLRIPSGILTPQQLKAIGEAAEKFANGKLHITTRQDIQIHNVPFEDSIKIIEYLKDYNISPRGGGGNTVRNITGCYLSGICPYEKVEVYKIVWGLTEYLLSLDESLNLPRKFKISFSGCQKDCCFAGVNDVGFVGIDGYFKVLCGGGMGAKSAVGKVIEEKIEIEEVGYVVKSIINVFNKYGDRKNRHQNRLRFLIQNLSWEKFIELYKEELKKLKDTEYINLRLENGLPLLPEIYDGYLIGCSEDKVYNMFLKYNTGKQKQKGYYYAQIRVPLGEVNAQQLINLSEIGSEIPYVIFRTTQRQNIVVSNIPYNKMFYVYEKIKSIFNDFLYPETVLDVVSCKAATTCNLGICNAIDMAKEIVKELGSKIDLDTIDKLKNIKININGCPNACGQHPIGTISFSGLARKVYNRTVPFYKIYIGGKIDAENTKLAEEIGVVPARVVPELILEFLLNFKCDFEILRQLIKKYSYVPPYEEDKSYYFDWGKDTEFSLEGLSQGECGAGVLDMIESDIESARQSLIKAKDKNFDISEIKNALVYAARALLIVKGVDPKDEKHAILSFVEKFVKTGICEIRFENIIEFYDNLVLGKIQKEDAYKFTTEFYNEIKNIYSSMDSNFNFPTKIVEQQEKKTTLSDQTSITIYDLRNTPCPINYVKVKLKLEELKIGDILEVYLDDGEPIKNVPQSLKNDGQEIINIEKVDNFYKVFVKKKV